MNKRLKTRDEWLQQQEARERIAIGLILYKDLQVSFAGLDWMEAAEESWQVAEIMGVRKEYDNLIMKVPKMKVVES